MRVFQSRSSGIECAIGPCSSDRGGVPPKMTIFALIGRLKGHRSMRIILHFWHLRKQVCRGNRFWSKGDCIDSWFGFGRDKQVYPLPGKERQRAVNGTVAVNRFGIIKAAQVPRSASYWWAGLYPFCEEFFEATPFECGSLLQFGIKFVNIFQPVCPMIAGKVCNNFFCSFKIFYCVYS